MALNFLDPIFLPLFEYNLLFGIGTIAFIIILASTLIYKYTTDQIFMQRIKREIKELQTKAKEAKDNPEKVMSLNKEMFKKSMEQMKTNFKSSLYTMIPIMIILLYLSNFSFAPINTGQNFDLEITAKNNIDLDLTNDDFKLISTNKHKIKNKYITEYELMSDKEGDYSVIVNNLTHTIRITNSFGYITPEQEFDNNDIEKIETKHGKLIFLNLFGWKLGWLGSYIILSIVFSIVIRRVLNVH